MWCKKRYRAEEKRGDFPPRCGCGKILKPDVVLFGEAIPEQALLRSFRLAESARVLMIVGTSAVVYPAASIPVIAKQNDAKIIEINIERTHLTESLTDIFIMGEAGDVIERLVSAVKRNFS
jgi:NAD-dependent deacetylase